MDSMVDFAILNSLGKGKIVLKKHGSRWKRKAIRLSLIHVGGVQQNLVQDNMVQLHCLTSLL